MKFVYAALMMLIRLMTKTLLVFSFHVSQRNKNGALLSKDSEGSTLISDSGLFRFENLEILFSSFVIIREEASREGKREEDCLESETHFKGFPKKQPGKSEMKPANKAARGNK